MCTRDVVRVLQTTLKANIHGLHRLIDSRFFFWAKKISNQRDLYQWPIDSLFLAKRTRSTIQKFSVLSLGQRNPLILLLLHFKVKLLLSPFKYQVYVNSNIHLNPTLFPRNNMRPLGNCSLRIVFKILSIASRKFQPLAVNLVGSVSMVNVSSCCDLTDCAYVLNVNIWLFGLCWKSLVLKPIRSSPLY